MRILIITTNVGRTAPGIVFERLIQGLSAIHEIDVLTGDYDPSIDLSHVENTLISRKINVDRRIVKLFISLFKVDPYDIYWAIKSLKILEFKERNKYDIVFSFLSFHHYAALIAGKIIAKKFKCKYAVYSVDAVPAPVGWPENQGYRKGVLKLMARYLSKSDAFFSANEQMLNYQMSTFTSAKNLISDVLYNPSINKIKKYGNSNDGVNHFIYTGGIYGARKVNFLLEGFEKLLEIYPYSKLIFVGSYISPLSLSDLKPETIMKIEITPFTKDLDPYYSCATALIDIDADLENDVYISSKIINYIAVDRIIISETGLNSPSRNLFKNIDSIIQCNHDSIQIFKAMRKAIELRDTISFENRTSVAELFSIDSIIKRLDKSLLKLSLIDV